MTRVKPQPSACPSDLYRRRRTRKRERENPPGKRKKKKKAISVSIRFVSTIPFRSFTTNTINNSDGARERLVCDVCENYRSRHLVLRDTRNMDVRRCYGQNNDLGQTTILSTVTRFMTNRTFRNKHIILRSRKNPTCVTRRRLYYNNNNTKFGLCRLFKTILHKNESDKRIGWRN